MKSFTIIDGKADASLAPTIKDMVARGEAYMQECDRRKVRFLPIQVIRPIWASNGLADGPLLKSHGTKLFLDFLKS